jgi:hypothetical protein
MKSLAEDDKGEEKKELDEGEDNHRVVGCSSSSPVEGNDLDKERDSGGSDSEEDSNSELVDLPKELSGLASKTYDFRDELDADLKHHGFPDLRVVVDPKSKKARLRMPSGAHIEVTDLYTRWFNNKWGKGRWGVACENTNIFIQALRDRSETRREPDISFWGPHKCYLDEEAGVLRPKRLSKPPKIHGAREQIERVNPDVVLQVSWGNDMGYEVKAINDMMNRALVVHVPPQPNNEAPRLGFLFKIRKHRKRRTRDGRKKVTKIDVYRIPHGATVEDAIANRNGASLTSYTPGQQDVTMEITAQDLGIEGEELCPPPFTISTKRIYEELR